MEEVAGVDDSRPSIDAKADRRRRLERRIGGAGEQGSRYPRVALTIVEELSAPGEGRHQARPPQRVLERSRVVERELRVIPVLRVDRSRREVQESKWND